MRKAIGFVAAVLGVVALATLSSLAYESHDAGRYQVAQASPDSVCDAYRVDTRSGEVRCLIFNRALTVQLIAEPRLGAESLGSSTPAASKQPQR